MADTPDLACDHCGVEPRTLVECTRCALRVCPDCPCECDDDDAGDDQVDEDDDDEDAA